jgi:hypothetical protein
MIRTEKLVLRIQLPKLDKMEKPQTLKFVVGNGLPYFVAYKTYRTTRRTLIFSLEILNK